MAKELEMNCKEDYYEALVSCLDSILTMDSEEQALELFQTATLLLVDYYRYCCSNVLWPKLQNKE